MGDKVLIIGSGGREHALGWKIAQSHEVDEVFFMPGNAGTEVEHKAKNVDIDFNDFDKVYSFIEKEKIDMVVVGPEDPLDAGIVDFLNEKGYDKVFGPSKEAAKLESDKFFSFNILEDLKIPQAKGITCTTTEEAIEAIEKIADDGGVVIKARGLAAGKGVSVCDSKKEALDEIKKHSKQFGSDVLISERLHGEEFSVFGIADGNSFTPIEMSFQDHKRAHDGDKGPNTGGMGAYGPAPIAPRDVVLKVAKEVMEPVVKEMKKRGTEFKGFLYAGMITTKQGPKVIEFNVRFGDPECQPAMMIIKSDLYKALRLALEGRLNEIELRFQEGAACCLVLASPGYPLEYEKGMHIHGVEKADQIEWVKVFHSGTRKKDGKLVAHGGRVLGITAHSTEGIEDARRIAYDAAEHISVEGGFHFRKDIASKAL